jgi:hypothetical protein
MRTTAIAGLAVIGTGISGSALAHHTHAHYEAERTIVLNGTVKEFDWRNPHSWITIQVRDDSGQMRDWLLEARAPASLARNGWTQESLKPGDSVAITVRPLKSGGVGGLVRQVTLANGTVLKDD